MSTKLRNTKAENQDGVEVKGNMILAVLVWIFKKEDVFMLLLLKHNLKAFLKFTRDN